MWAGDRRNCGKPSGLQYGCAYSNPTQKGEKERSTGELMAVVYIPKLEFKIKACNTCGKEIPKGDPCFWDKSNKKNYHDNNKCYDVKANPSRAGVEGTPPNGLPNEAPAAIATPTQAQITQRVTQRLNLSKEIVARAFGQEAVGLEAPAFAGLIEETFRQLWSEVAMVKIQKQKEENIDRVKR